MIEPISLPAAAGIDYGNGDVRHFAQGDAVDVPGLSNPTRELAQRDNILAEKLNEVVQTVNNREQFVPLPVIRTIVASGDEVIVTNYRIPEGFEARILNAAISSTPSSTKAQLNLYYSAVYGDTAGTLIVTATPAAEFTGETSFHQSGEIVVSLKNTGVGTLDICASVTLTMRPVGAVGSLLVGSVIKGDKGDPGQKGDPGPPGPAGIGTAGSKGMNWKGVWSISTSYVIDDVVSYTSSSVLSSYICKTGNTGLAPDTNPAAWDLVAKGGADGAAGPAGPTGAAGAPGAPGGVPNYKSSVITGTLATGPEWASNPLDYYNSINLAANATKNDIPMSEVYIQSASSNPGYGSTASLLAGVMRLSFKGVGTFTLPSIASGAKVNYTNSTCTMFSALNGTTPYSTLDGSIKGIMTYPVNTNQFVIKSLNGDFVTAEVSLLGMQVV